MQPKKTITPRDYQLKGYNEVRAAFAEKTESGERAHRAVLYVLPTGGGKTIFFSYLTMKAVERGSKVMILVHRDSLFKQTSATLAGLGIAHGLIGAGYYEDYRHLVQVAKVGTVVNRLNKFTPDVIIVDECHHTNAGTYLKILNAYPQARVLGVTATPCRTDGAGLGEIYTKMILGPAISELIEMGFLVEPVIFAPPVGVDLSGIRKSMGDYVKSELNDVMDKPKITGDVIAHYRKYADGLPAVTFCVSVQHAEHVAEMFRGAGYIAESVHGGMEQKEIDSILSGLGSGRIQVVTSCDLISEGTDIPAIGAVILLRPTMSLSLYLQQVGRGLRPFAGKENAIILDHVGNISRHGHPCSDFGWSLEGVKKAKKGEKQESGVIVQECESCYRVYKAELECCPSCGWKPEKKARALKEVDGELERVSGIEKAEAEKKKAEQKREIGMARTYQQLLDLEKKLGHKKGWAWNLWNARGQKKK